MSAAVIVFIVIGLFFAGMWVLTEAFGPETREVTIGLKNDRKLICKETYSADLAAVFYDVDFKLKDKNENPVYLGRSTFSNENWSKDIKLNEIGNWILLPVEESRCAKILMLQRQTKMNRDTIFSPVDLRYDSIWRSKYDGIPSAFYRGSSGIDTIAGNKFHIIYEYRIGDRGPFKFYRQTIIHEMDLTTGTFETKCVFERETIQQPAKER